MSTRTRLIAVVGCVVLLLFYVSTVTPSSNVEGGSVASVTSDPDEVAPTGIMQPRVQQQPSTIEQRLPPAVSSSNIPSSSMMIPPRGGSSTILQAPRSSETIVVPEFTPLSRNDSRLRCGKAHRSGGCTEWFHRSWFSDVRSDDLDGPFTETRISKSEERTLDPDANATSDVSVIAAHEAAEWRAHWQLRYPKVKWSAPRSRPTREMPNAVLEEYEMKHQQMIRSTQPPQRDSDLEFIHNVPPIYLYRRPQPEARWEALEASLGYRPIRIACLFAGFPRDVESMYASCRDRRSERHCRDRYTFKRFGGMRDNIIHSTNCDVFASTWEIRGAGRYSTTTYDMKSSFDPKTLHSLYGDRLAGLHMQNFTQYQQLWRYMHKFSRPFPQTRPTKLHIDQQTSDSSFEGIPELNYFIRINDYSQSYKHWCVTHLALLSQVGYDLFFRLRFDLRSTARIHSFNPAMGELVSTGEVFGRQRAVGFYLDRSAASVATSRGNTSSSTVVGAPFSLRARFVSSKRIHVGNFDIADFGFLGPPYMIEELSRLWYYCLGEPSSPLAPEDFVPSITPKAMYSEYNLMLWRIIFDNKWTVDSGGRYLWVSRFGSRRK